MPKAKRPRLYERLLVRPRALAGSRAEVPAAVGCGAALVLVFIGEMGTPSSVIGILALFPLVASTWLLSRHVAYLTLAGAVLLLFPEVAAGSIDRLTAAVEVVAYLAVAGTVHLYASRFELLFPRPSRPSFDRLIARLSQREREIVQLTVQGHTAPQIADLLHLSERTVETHLANAYGKLGVTSKIDLVRRAVS